MKQGKLFFDEGTGRYNFIYRGEDGKLRDYGGIHCGEVFEFHLNGEWVAARVEMAEGGWYLVGMSGLELNGLEIRRR